MTMTRKDFISIATAISENTIDYGYSLNKDTLIHSLCIIFEATNERFDSAKFINACYNSPAHRYQPYSSE
jgi:hypothetical protein